MRTVKKQILFLSLLLIISASQAQLVVQPAVPRMGIIQKTQLWNLLAINTLAEEAEIRIDLVLQDRQTGHTLLTAQSGTIKLSKGARQLNEQAVFPVQYKYESIFSNYNQQALLPIGNYLACYTIIRLPKQEPAGQECVAIDVAPLSPPMLIYPANGSIIVEGSPQLSWIPPTPANLFSQLRYDILVTELYNGQSPDEAIQRNTPMFAMGNIPQQSLAYPASAASLDTGKIYAWQIIAKNGESYAAKSDVWTFKLRPQTKAEQIIEMTPFVKMKREDAEMTIAPNGILKFNYFHQAESMEVVIEINDLTTKSEGKQRPFKIQVQKGENYQQETLRKHVKLEAGHIYSATLTNSSKESYYLRFEVKNYND